MSSSLQYGATQMLVDKKSLKKASVLGEKSLFQLRILERFSTTSYLVVRGERVNEDLQLVLNVYHKDEFIFSISTL